MTKADVIVFCGVRFMAEVAKILSPNKTVILPDNRAGCSLEESCRADMFKKFKEKHPDHIVLSYINCSAEIKALSDIIVTSYNAKKIIDAKNQTVIPGVIDVHFHVRAPSFPERGTVESETKAAAKGGITTLFEMPISNPCMSNGKVLKDRKEHFLKNTIINFSFIPAIGKLTNSNLSSLIKNGAIAFKIFTIAAPANRKSEFDGLCFTKENEILEALIHAKKSNLTTIFHAEDQGLLNYFKHKENEFEKSDPAVHNATRPPITEALAISKILNLNMIAKSKIHIAHVTSELSVDLISYFQKELAFDQNIKSFYLILTVVLSLLFYLIISYLIKAFKMNDFKLKY